jgi:hypothetical protein
MRAWGFSQRWCDWIALIMSTASTKVRLNGQPGERIWHRRGLRQGDPLSLMLFVLVMDVLNRLLGRAREHGVLQPVGHPNNQISV